MTAGRLASPEGWQVSVRLFGGSCGSVLGAGGPVFGMLVVGTLVVEGPRGWMGRWWALAGERIGDGRFGGGCAGGGVGGSDASGALMVGWCWRAGRGTDRWWRDW